MDLSIRRIISANEGMDVGEITYAALGSIINKVDHSLAPAASEPKVASLSDYTLSELVDQIVHRFDNTAQIQDVIAYALFSMWQSIDRELERRMDAEADAHQITDEEMEAMDDWDVVELNAV